jgi:K+-sensing histidine kinase KdpD
MEAGMSRDTIDLKFGEEENIARNILEEAQAENYETVVIGRGAPTWRQRIFAGEVTQQLLQSANGLSIWIVGQSLKRDIP